MTNFIRRKFYSRSEPPPVGTVHIGEEQLPVAVDHLLGVEANIALGIAGFDIAAMLGVESDIGGGVMAADVIMLTATELDRGSLHAVGAGPLMAIEADLGALMPADVYMIASTEVDLGALMPIAASPIVAIEADRGALQEVAFRRWSRVDGSWPDTPLPDLPWTDLVTYTGIFSHEET